MCICIAAKQFALRCLLVLGLVFAATATFAQTYDWSNPTKILYPGVKYAKVTYSSPRNMVFHCLQIDLASPGIRLHTQERYEPWVANVNEFLRKTTRKWIYQTQSQNRKVLAAVNTTEMTPYPGSGYNAEVAAELMGFCVSAGTIVSPSYGYGETTPGFYYDASGLMYLKTGVTNQPVGTLDTVITCMFGYELINGVPQVMGTDLNCRTTYGLSQDGRYLYLLTCDGKTTTSQGATHQEMGAEALKFGAYNAQGMDGGGSTTMAWWNPASGSADKSTLLNVPVGNGSTAGTERTVHSYGVYKVSATSLSWNLGDNFTTNGPNPFYVHDGGKWEYGYCASLGAALQTYPYKGTYATNIPNWFMDSATSLTYGNMNKNVGASAYEEAGSPGGFHWDPGDACLLSPTDAESASKAVARFKALNPGTYSLDVTFYGRNYLAGSTSDVYIQKNGTTTIAYGTVSGFAGTAANNWEDAFGTNPWVTYTGSVSLNAGDTLDFVVGKGGDTGADLIGLDATITLDTGSISGTVTSGGSPVADALIKSNGDVWAVTDASGNYSIPMAPAGTYNLTAGKSGYADQTESVTVASGQNTDRDFTLTSLILFYDGFESGNFTAGGWTNSGCDIQTTYKYAGSRAARFNSSDSLTKALSTAGSSGITVQYARYTRSCETDDHFISEWSADGGSNWTTLEDLTGNSGWTVKTYNLPAGADNNPNFRLRFRTSHNGSLDYAYLDEVRIIRAP